MTIGDLEDFKELRTKSMKLVQDLDAERIRAFRINQALSKTTRLLMERIGEFEDDEDVPSPGLTDGEKAEYKNLKLIRVSQDLAVTDWNVLMKALWGV